jgi:beta-lactamase regulating signal transducer with metallopeptidase domain
VILHLLVSSAILSLAIAAAAWIPRLTARTRHAVLIAGMASLLVPSTFIARAIERSGTTVMMPVRMAMPLLVNTPIAAPGPSELPWTKIAVGIWLGVAGLLFLRSVLITHRLVANATRIGTPPPARTFAALEAARRRLALHTSVDLIASPLCEAPAVLRVLRPIIVLPSDGCQSLGDDELESLLCHECAHVARHDNLVGFLENIAGALFWFNPLVWLARRHAASSREEACDERVTDAAMPAETYVGALAKLCRTLVAPRVTAVSCMANAHLKERIEHLMKYDSMRATALSHRRTTAASAFAVVALIFAGGIISASPNQKNAGEKKPYQLNFATARLNQSTVLFTVKIIDTATGQHVAETSLRTKPGVPVSADLGRENDRWHVDVATDDTGAGTVTLVATKNGAEVQRTHTSFPAAQQAERTQPLYNGAPISMNLANADLRDVLKTFGQISGLEMVMGPEIQGIVNVNYTDVPWDEALDELLKSNGYTWRLEGQKMTIIRAGS